MPSPKITIINGTEIIERDMNEQEIQDLEKLRSDIAASKEAEQKVINEKSAKKEILLAKLGITSEEAEILLS